MNRYLLIGDYSKNSGPSNVNRSIINNSDKYLLYLKSTKSFLRVIEFFLKLLFSKAVIFSNDYSTHKLLFVKFFRKKIILIAHGNIDYETNINKLNTSLDTLKAESKFLKYSSLIVCVSEIYSNWYKNKYPQYSDKITFVNNGIKIQLRPKIEKEQFLIAVGGGNRNQKNNYEVCEAISLLMSEGIRCELLVFGCYYNNNQNLDKYPFVKFLGQLDKEKYYHLLDNVNLYVMNSEIESYGLSLFDALNSNCSLLLSKNVGASKIFKLEQQDIIYDCHDVKEIAYKIKNLLFNSNFERLYKSGNYSSSDETKTYFEICEKIKRIL